MRSIHLVVIFVFFYSCKKNITKNVNHKIEVERFVRHNDSLKIKNGQPKAVLKSLIDLKKLVNSIENVKNVAGKHKDWMSNRIGFLDLLMNVNKDSIIVKTTSYEYNKKCIFYLHKLTPVNSDSSLKSFLENAQGKTTRGYTRNRVLIFSMLNDKEANFIDIPEKLNPLALRKELLKKLYEKIDGDIILCNRIKSCEYKDLRQKSSD